MAVATGSDLMSEDEAELRRRWDDLTAFVSAPVKEKWWTRIRDRHAARPFHNLRRLARQLRLFDDFKDQLRDRYAVGFAIFFKHLECDGDEPAGGEATGDTAAERNVQRLHEFCAETTFDQEHYVADLLTAGANNCTEAHLQSRVYGSDDLHYFIDVDSAWLGTSDPEEYSRAAAEIRVETLRGNRNQNADENEYRQQRLRTLEFFLQIPNIFATRLFRERYEAPARANIQREIDALRAELTGG